MQNLVIDMLVMLNTFIAGPETNSCILEYLRVYMSVKVKSIYGYIYEK